MAQQVKMLADLSLNPMSHMMELIPVSGRLTSTHIS